MLHRDSIYLDVIGNRDDQTFPSVYDPGLHQIGPVRAYSNRNVRGMDLKLAAAHDVSQHQSTLLACVLLKTGVKALHVLRRRSALLEQAAHSGPVKGYRVRTVCVLRLLADLLKAVMKSLHRVKAAVLAKRFLDHCLESLFLKSCRQGQLAAQQLVRQVKVQVLRVFRIVECVMDICRSVVERREHEADLRHSDHPVSYPVVEGLLRRFIGKRRL